MSLFNVIFFQFRAGIRSATVGMCAALPAAVLAAALVASPLVMQQPANAGPALLFEPSNGKVLYAEDPDALWHPASLTKIMTAYLTFEAIKNGKLSFDDKVRCSLTASVQPPSKLGLPVGTELSIDMALKSIIIKSANDVTVMLAEKISGSETAFVAKMNETAQRLGMTRTHYANTNGLPDKEQVTTARDLAKLARAVTSEYGQYAHYWTMSDMRLGKKRLSSHNSLLKSFPGADGLKTGFTCDSGFNVIASATRDGRRLMAIVLGESSGDERSVRAGSLLEHGFQTYGWKTYFNTTSIDSEPAKLTVEEALSVRDEVSAWSCSTKKKKSAAKAPKKNSKIRAAAAKARAAAKADAKALAESKAQPSKKTSPGTSKEAKAWPEPTVVFKPSTTP